MLSASAESVPGRIGIHSLALLAAGPPTGSTTTSFMPRARASAMSSEWWLRALRVAMPNCVPTRMQYSA